MTDLKEIKYLFIDGACLDNILQRIGDKFFNRKKVKIKYEILGAGYDKVFYYDALPIQKKSETKKDYEIRFKEKELFLNNLKLLNKFHVYEGVVFNRKEKLTQKAVDIMIAVDMLRHSSRKNMNKATLLTGDMDFKPLLDALVLEGMYTTILYDPRITSHELLYAADSNEEITLSRLYSMATEEFKKKNPAPRMYSADITSFLSNWEKFFEKKGSFLGTQLMQYNINGNYALMYQPKTGGGMIAEYNDLKTLIGWVEYNYNERIIW